MLRCRLILALGFCVFSSSQAASVLLCCNGCTEKAKASPTDTLAKTAALIKAGMDDANHANPDHAPTKK